MQSLLQGRTDWLRVRHGRLISLFNPLSLCPLHSRGGTCRKGDVNVRMLKMGKQRPLVPRKQFTIDLTFSRRELARRGLRRQQEARERVVKKAVARGEMGLYVTDAMVRQEMSRQAVEHMQGKVSGATLEFDRDVIAMHFTTVVVCSCG